MAFEDFWRHYPRRVAKAEAVKAWAKMPADAREKALDALPAHIAYWEQTQTEKTFIPHPATWLRGERYEDEIEIPQPKPKQDITPGWWATDKGTEDMGRKLGMSPRPGETWGQFKDRIRARITEAA